MAKKLSFIDSILTEESTSVKPYTYRAKVLRGNDIVLKEDYNGKPIKKWECSSHEQAVQIANKLNEQAPKPEVFEEGEKVARKCSATGEGMNEGYCFGEGEEYFKYEEDLIAHLRKNGDEEFNKASDEFILKESYDLEEYYHTVWEDLEEDAQYIVRGGKLVEIEEEVKVVEKHEIDIAKDILKKHGYIMCFWQLEDVLECAQQNNISISEQDAQNVVKWIEKYHDANEGINWDIIKIAINVYLSEK